MSVAILLVIVAAVFLLAGFFKGLIGLGLPTVAVGLLGLVMPPWEAAALLVVPSLATNVWQAAAGGHFASLLRRLWPLLVAICLGTWLGGLVVARTDAAAATAALGLALALYGLAGLSRLQPRVPPAAERWLGPLVGALTGAVTAATGVFVIPGVPYLQALGLDRGALVQALGLSFTVSTLALAAELAQDGVMQAALLGQSVLALVPAVAGMLLGQRVRDRVRPDVFRRSFFAGLLLLGSYLSFSAVA